MPLERRHDHGSMSMGGFRPVNERLSRAYWYTIVGVVGLLMFMRLQRLWESRQRQALHQKDPKTIASRPRGRLSQTYATVTATAREIAYPQPVYFTGPISKYFSPLPVGRWVLLAIYWTVLLCFLWTDVLLFPGDSQYAYKWEKVGYRAAWVSVAQIPFIYLLSCKFNPISILTGISYERFNWLHRWAARTIFLTAIVHWSYFYRQWDIADFVKYQLEMMPMVKYGFGAWGVIGWMVLTGFGFVRVRSYEIFVAQHICAAAVLLWLLWVHVPDYAHYYLRMAIAFVVFDWVARLVWAILRNSHLHLGLKKPGYSVELESLPGNMVRLTINDIDFSWKAGQHAYISVPRLRPFEIHPFTIANASSDDRNLTMVVKAHSGFTGSVRKAAEKESRTCRAILSGPWGNPPDLLHYDTVVLIACSSGASFVMPLLQELVSKQSCARQVTLHWIVRERDHIAWYEKALRQVVDAAEECRFRLEVVVHITRSCKRGGDAAVDESQGRVRGEKSELAVEIGEASASSSDSSASEEVEKLATSQPQTWIELLQRPTVESMIRPSVEAALGETAVVVCGGISITAECRTFVAALSDQRAVHKGTGAQGIFLFTETYGW